MSTPDWQKRWQHRPEDVGEPQSLEPVGDGEEAPCSDVANPAWVVLDLMRSMGIPEREIDLDVFQAWADYCDERIEGNSPPTSGNGATEGEEEHDI